MMPENTGERMTIEENVAALIFDYEWEEGDRPHEEDCMELGRKNVAYLGVTPREDNNG